VPPNRHSPSGIPQLPRRHRLTFGHSFNRKGQKPMHTPLESMFDTLHTIQFTAEIAVTLLLAVLGAAMLWWRPLARK
jgi:hypothetical protein